MSVASLYNLNLDSPESVLEFSFNNQCHHIDVQKAIIKTKAINLPLYPIDPIPSFDNVTWLQNHQAMHSAVNGVLGTQSNDLSTLDPTKPEDVEVFTYLHAQEHYRWSIILGVP